MAVPPPALRSAKVLLRPLCEQDIPALVAACNNPTTRQWIALPDPYTAELAQDYIKPVEGSHIWAFCAVDEGSSAADAVGSVDTVPAICGTIDLRWTKPEDPGFADIGYHCFPTARRKGLTTAALGLVVDYAMQAGVQRLELRANVDNAASRRVAEKAGFDFEGILRNSMLFQGQRRDMAVYSIVAS